MEEVASFFNGSVPVGHSSSSSSLSSGLSSLTQSSHLIICGEKTHSEEMISKNGLQKSIHVVVKNSPFHITLGLSSQVGLDLNRISFDASLVYDDGGKEVDYVKSKPVELKTTPSDNGKQIDCELRVKVLTSHHEDLLFKIKIQGFNPITQDEIPLCFVHTSPLKVISKPEQLKKRPPSKKRTLTDMLVETITRIEKKQEEQQSLIERVLNQQLLMPISLTATSSSFAPSSPPDSLTKRHKHDLFWERMTDMEDNRDKDLDKDKDGKKELVDFEAAFGSMLKAYNSMTPEEKPETIRKMIRGSSSRETERLSELLDLFWTEGLLKERSFGKNANANNMVHSSHDGCTCIECPHKVELEHIDDFYKEFLHTGYSMPTF